MSSSEEEWYPVHSQPYIVTVSKTYCVDILVHAADELEAEDLAEDGHAEDLAEELVEWKVEAVHQLADTAYSKDFEVAEKDFKYVDPFSNVD